ncbi:UMP-CMP kinase 2, mitochondrial-like isoform X2 [Mizuhopecten yessoensis]|uniref:UMP-CMP kinase 2, mitochondrial-like isoform X2 n=1 Tax=Mizuhopecten yessoensis TaxID=6573 RepID=UPI000B4575BE|nr:UMP-CMP kinase 2, mitochondrial-like isoform X2 [Mizuhopecten yessoensis]
MFGALCVSILKQARICEKKIRPSAQVQVVKLWKMSFSTEPSSRGEFTYIAFPDKPTYLSKLNRNCAKENDHCAGLTDASDITSDVPEVAELLTIADRLIPQDLNVQQLQENMKHPFVVVEGMDATGKTTLTKILGDRLSAVRLYTPPPPIEHLRKIFDRLPELVRRAYYSIGNYIVAMEISKECQERAVVMDRYWHSTAAYGIANESSTGDLPRSGHPVYQWPTDLLRPTAVLFLTVGEEKRKQRLQGRGIEKTFEERSLDKDQLFRQRLCDAYRRMENPSLVEVDASGTVEEVVKSAIEKLTNCGVYVPSDTHV